MMLIPAVHAQPATINLIRAGIAVSTTIPIPNGGGGIAGLSTYITTIFFPMFQALFLGVALIMFFWYALQLLLESGEENVVTETKQAYEYAIFGAAIMSFASLIISAFGVGSGAAGSTLVNPGPLSSALTQAIIYFKTLVSALVTVVIFIQGFRLIALQGKEGEMEGQKKQFFYTLIGVAIILLAEAVVGSVQPGANAGILSVEIVGIINFLLAIFGLLAVIAFAVSGAMLILSVSETLKDRAKKTIQSAIVALVVVLAAYVIVRFVLSL